MGMRMRYKTGGSYLLLILSAFLLTGCPGAGDRLKADETTTVSKAGEDVCFQVSDAKGYQPSLIAINPRGTPPQKLSVTDSPNLTVKNGELCIPPGFYRFPAKGQFIVQYILEVPGEQGSQRSVVTGVEFSGSHVRNTPLTNRETTR